MEGDGAEQRLELLALASVVSPGRRPCLVGLLLGAGRGGHPGQLLVGPRLFGGGARDRAADHDPAPVGTTANDRARTASTSSSEWVEVVFARSVGAGGDGVDLLGEAVEALVEGGLGGVDRLREGGQVAGTRLDGGHHIGGGPVVGGGGGRQGVEGGGQGGVGTQLPQQVAVRR